MELLRECSEKSGMRIIASSGHWLVPSPTFGNRTARSSRTCSSRS
ncbi:MAG: hypothetical protein U0869_05005 [Chloroflexota bacterium]